MWNRWDLLRSFSYLFSEGSYRYMPLLHLSQGDNVETGCVLPKYNGIVVHSRLVLISTGIFPCAAEVITQGSSFSRVFSGKVTRLFTFLPFSQYLLINKLPISGTKYHKIYTNAAEGIYIVQMIVRYRVFLGVVSAVVSLKMEYLFASIFNNIFQIFVK